MKKRNWASVIAIVFMILSAAAFPYLAYGADQNIDHKNEIKALRFKQWHVYLGNIDVTIAPTGIRMEGAGKLHFTLVSSGPLWIVEIFRKDDKVIKTDTLQHFLNEGLVPEIMLPYRARIVYSKEGPHQYKYYGFAAHRVATADDIVDFLPLKGIAAPQIEQILYACYRLPTNGGIPVRNIRATAGTDFLSGLSIDGHENNLTTSSIKSIWVGKDYFSAPKGYRAAKAMQEILTSSQAREQSEDFQALMDADGRHTKHKEKPKGR